MYSLRRTFQLAFLVAILSTPFIVSAQSASSTSSTAAATAAPAPGATIDDGSEYYPSGSDYSDDQSITSAEDAGQYDGSNDGKAQPFMGLSKGAQIGVIVAVVLVGVTGLGGLVFFYFHRRRAWEKEVARRSAVLSHIIRTERGDFIRANSGSANLKKTGSPTSSNFDIEKSAGETGNTTTVRSEFEGDTANTSTWKKWFGRR